MAKYRHRVFEMYEFLDEAILALTPRSEKPSTEPTAPESWDFKYLRVSRSEGVTRVRFKGAQGFPAESLADLRDDFVLLAERLGRNSKVLLDFKGVKAFDPGHIDAIVLLNQKLQTKGSRIVLCCLAPAVRKSFFPSLPAGTA